MFSPKRKPPGGDGEHRVPACLKRPAKISLRLQSGFAMVALEVIRMDSNRGYLETICYVQRF